MKNPNTKGRRLAGLLLSLALLLAAFPPIEAAAASTPGVYSKMSASYKSGEYYQRLMSVKLTGNQITDLIQVAVSQLGYHESNSKSDLSGSGSGSGNCTEYGNFTGTNGLAWCASFVSWCFREAGIPTSVVPTAARVCNIVRPAVYNKGAAWHSVDSGYKPKAGDLVAYESMGGNYTYYQYSNRDSNGIPMLSSHIGIVVSDFDPKTQTYCVIDGNGNQGCVKYLTGQKLYMPGPAKGGGTMNRIQGFVTPAYTSGPTGGFYNGSRVVIPNPTAGVTLGLPRQDGTYTDYAAYLKEDGTAKAGTSFAYLVCRLDKPSSAVLESMSVTLYGKDGKSVLASRTFTYEDDTPSLRQETVRHAIWQTNGNLPVTLEEATTYWYEFSAVVNGAEVRSPRYSVTTLGSAGNTTVRFNAGGGEAEFYTRSVPTGSPIGQLPDAAREGYTFLGWVKDDMADPAKAEYITPDYIVQAPVTVYAMWSLGEAVEQDETPAGSEAAGDSAALPGSVSVSVDPALMTLTAASRALRFTVDKPAGAEVAGISVNIYTKEGSRITGYEKDFTGNTELAEDDSANFSVSLGSQVLQNLYYDTVYSYDIYVTVEGSRYASRQGEFIFVSEQTPSVQPDRESFEMDFYDMNAVIRIATVTQTSGEKYVLPEKKPALSGYAFGGWYLTHDLRVSEAVTADPAYGKTAYVRWLPLSDYARVFTDVGSGEYYYQPVSWAVNQGITAGTSASTFSPNQTCTRGQIISFLWRAAGSPAPKSGTAGFSDVPSGQYYTNACLWAREQGMVTGSRFEPNAPCTRAMAVEFIWRYEGQPKAVVELPFTDVNPGDSCAGAVAWALQQGITAGTAADTFSPGQTCTRAQIVSFLYRALA